MKKCGKCKKIKNDFEFPHNKCTKTGLYSYCRVCESQIKKLEHQKEVQIFHKLKINGCAICGYNKCFDALDFHHSNPENKKFQISSIKLNKKDFIEELNKCILLCANCHRETHVEKKAKKDGNENGEGEL